MLNRKKKIQIKDLVAIGVYTALYFIMVAISALLVVFIIPGYSYVFIPVVSALLSGTIFMLLVAKVPRFGAITIMGCVVGFFFFFLFFQVIFMSLFQWFLLCYQALFLCCWWLRSQDLEQSRLWVPLWGSSFLLWVVFQEHYLYVL